MRNRPLHSILYMPASNQRALTKAEILPADGLILDLEDATVIEQKIDARQLVKAKLADKPYGKKLVIIRTNDQNTIWYQDDMAMAVEAKADVVLVPKVNSANDVTNILQDMENAPENMALWVMIETPMALLNINEIAALGQVSRLGGLVLGTNDLAKDMQIPLPTEDYPERAGFQTYFASCVLAAKAYGLVVLDGVYNHFNDEVGLEIETEQARQFGFDGKTLIHPNQIELVNGIFEPTEAELEAAQNIVDAFAKQENATLGAITVDGKMVERLHADIAQQMIAKAEFYE